VLSTQRAFRHDPCCRQCLNRRNCPRRSGYNTSLFSDVTGGDQCLDGTCYHIKLNEHVRREVLARPELVQIETAFRHPKERQPEALSRNEYTVVDVPKDEDEDPLVSVPCRSSIRNRQTANHSPS
jgi:ParB family chromosome partitioning protein